MGLALVVVLVAAVVLAVGVAALRIGLRHPRAADTPKAAGRYDPTTYNVLVLADQACPPEGIRDLVTERAAGRTTRAYVVAPALGSRLDRLAGGDDGYTHASSHLEATLAALEPVTVACDGRIGSHDPVQAVEEGLRELRADEVVLVMRPDGSENWLETGIVETCRARHGIPVTPLVAPAGVTARRPPP